MTTGSSEQGAHPKWAALGIKLAIAISSVLASIYLIHAWLTDTMDYSLFVHEWGVLEILHSVLTGVSAVLFYLGWRDGTGALKVGGGALAMLAAAGFVRELDIKKTAELTGPDWLYFLADHGLQEALLIAMTLPIFVYLFRERRYFMELVGLALSWRSWALILAGLFIVAGIYLDERIVNSMQLRFWEELIETYGYGFLVLAAWRHWGFAREARAQEEDRRSPSSGGAPHGM